MNPLLLGALISQIGIPELAAWLKSLHDAGEVVTEDAALQKLEMDVDEGDAAGKAFLASHAPVE
jgi:hypothetical protein